MYSQRMRAPRRRTSTRPRVTSSIATALVVLFSTFVTPFAATAQALEQVRPVEQSSPATPVEYRFESSSEAVVAAWTAPNPDAIVIAIHGFGLHKFAFKDFAEQMQRQNVSTYAIDVRGFGGWAQSAGGARVDFRRTLEDLETLVRTIRGEWPGKPVFVMGESMGGAIALAYAAAHPASIDGVISSVPSNKRFHRMRTTARIAAQYVLSGGRKINLDEVLVKRVTNDKALRTCWRNDAEAKLHVTLRELVRFNGFMKAVPRIVKEIDAVPVLVVQGYNDHLVMPAGTKKLFDNLSTGDKQFLLVQNAEHLVFEAGQFDESVVQELERWLARHEKPALLASNR